MPSQILRIVFLLSGPAVLRSLLAFLEEKDIKRTGDLELISASLDDKSDKGEDGSGFLMTEHHSNWYGVRCCVWLVLLGFLSSVCETHAYYQLNSGGVKMKSAVIAAVYKKSLRIVEPNGNFS